MYLLLSSSMLLLFSRGCMYKTYINRYQQGEKEIVTFRQEQIKLNYFFLHITVES